MSKPNTTLWVLVILGLLADACAAQVVKFPAEDFTFQVKVQRHPEEEKKAGATSNQAVGNPTSMRQTLGSQSIDVTRYKTVILYTFNRSSGRTTHALQHLKSNTILQQGINSGDVVVASEGYMALPEIIRPTAEGFNWINGRNLIEEEEIGGRLCRVYAKKTIVMRLPEGNSASFGPLPKEVVFKAWVDTETNQLVALDDTEAFYEVAEIKPYTGTFVMPEAFRGPWKKLQARLSPHRRL